VTLALHRSAVITWKAYTRWRRTGRHVSTIKWMITTTSQWDNHLILLDKTRIFCLPPAGAPRLLAFYSTDECNGKPG